MDSDRQSVRRELTRALKDAFLGASMGDYSMSAQQRRQQALVRMLETNQAPVQWVAIKELGEIGDLAAADAIMPFTISPNPDLQQAAKKAYRQIQDREGAASRAGAPLPPPPVVPTRKAAAGAMPPPPPPPPAGSVVEAHMGRSRETRLTKGQDLPVPLTETQLRQAGPQAEQAQAASSAPVVLAQMGRSRDTRLTKGQDLPVPLTETQLGQLKPHAEPSALSTGAAQAELPVPAGMPEPVGVMPEMAAMSSALPEMPARADIPGSVVDYSVLGIPMGQR